ncbi:hypothetical protein [Nonomuraea bangladeshensis]|uniref:hypothetical protein n=1 Tax=Nonomuraea bangladeshensis TaxID=404385 RepID=UPI003C2EE14F
MSEIAIPGGSPFEPDADLHCPFYRRYVAARALFQQEHPEGGYGVALIGRMAWATLPEKDRAATLDIFFTDYWMRLFDEEHEDRLATAANDGTSYIEPSDTADLWLCIKETKGSPECIDDVPRQALMNVLSELELLQHRLAAIELGEVMDQANAIDSGESK